MYKVPHGKGPHWSSQEFKIVMGVGLNL